MNISCLLLSFRMNSFPYSDSQGDFSITVLWKQTTWTLDWGRVFLQHELTFKHASSVHLTETEMPNTSKHSPILPSRDAFSHLHAGNSTKEQETSAKVWFCCWSGISEREPKTGRADPAGHLLMTRTAKIHDSTERGTEERTEAVWKDQPCWPGATWLRAPPEHSPPICSDQHLLDKNHSLHSS